MYLVAIAWLYVALMMAVVEATSSQGSLLGAAFTFVLYGLAPVALLMYLFGTPARLRARKLAEREADAVASAAGPTVDPDRGREPATVAEACAVSSERKEP
jgi:hypothetical protein